MVDKQRRESVPFEKLADVAFEVAAEGGGIGEIARRLNMNPDTVHIRLSGARKRARAEGMKDEEIAEQVVPSFTAVRGKPVKQTKDYFTQLHAARVKRLEESKSTEGETGETQETSESTE